MTHKVITLEFVIPTLLALALAIVLSIGAIYLTEMFLGPIVATPLQKNSARSQAGRTRAEG
jgi:hypothetical protein